VRVDISIDWDLIMFMIDDAKVVNSVVEDMVRIFFFSVNPTFIFYISDSELGNVWPLDSLWD